MRPLAIAVVMLGVVLLAFGTWIILRASFGAPRTRRARPAPGPVERAAGPRAAVPFPPAASVRQAAPPVSDEDAWRRPPPERVGGRLAEPTLSGAHPVIEPDRPDEPLAEPTLAGAHSEPPSD